MTSNSTGGHSHGVRLSVLCLPIALLGCGARTGLYAPEPTDAAIEDAPGDAPLDAGSASDAARVCPPVTVEVNSDPILGPVEQLALGTEHTCAIAAGATWCWGTDLQSELGTRTVSQARPVRVKAQPVTQIASGSAFDICTGPRGSHTCARLNEGRVVCWGANVEGSGDAKLAKPTLFPTEVAGLGQASQVAVGGYHTCAVVGSGARCWGSDDFGQLGDGAMGGTKGITDVVGVTNITQIANGHETTCAVVSGGKVRCWGAGTFGILGDGTTTTRATPADVTGIGMVGSIAMFWWHACAVLGDRSVACWGLNSSGQLGDGTKQDRSTPVKAVGLANTMQVSVGDTHSCAVLLDGTVRCWGSNSFGQLGAGPLGMQQTSPIAVPLANVAEVRTGLWHTCARTRDGVVWCWGWNEFGQLGDGTTTQRSSPVRVN